MPTPFPGMDPYVEHPGLWPDVHNGLIAELRNTLEPQPRPRYYEVVLHVATVAHVVCPRHWPVARVSYRWPHTRS
jgi:Protein of unknown function (DUF4058)